MFGVKCGIWSSYPIASVALSHVFECGLPKECIQGFLTSCIQSQRSPVISNMSVKCGSSAKNTKRQSVHHLNIPTWLHMRFASYTFWLIRYILSPFFPLSLICTVKPALPHSIPPTPPPLSHSYQAV